MARRSLIYATLAIALAFWGTAFRAAAQDYCGLNDLSPSACNQFSPVSPVAGNPQSLETRMIAGDFRLGSFAGPWPDFVSAGAGGAGLPDLFGVGFSYFTAGDDNYRQTYTELPFSYSRPLDDPRYALVFELPIGITDITTIGYGKARIYSASLGAGIRLPLLDNWIVTPTLRAGLSSDTGEDITAHLFGASLVSNYTASLGELNFSLGNQISRVKSYGDSGAIFDVSNTMFRNGIGLSGPTGKRLFDLPVTWEASAVNTQFSGNPLYVENMTDFAFSFGTQNSTNGVTWDSMRLGLTYTVSGTDFDGLAVNFGYRF